MLYSKDDILEFLVPDGMGDDAEQSCRERLQGVRQTLHTKLCEVFPAYTHSTLFNRRKVSAFAEDIVIIGYSIVNNQKDKRLSKTLKQAPNSQLPDSESFETSVIAAPMATDLADLTSVCASLKVSVSQLTQTIKELKAQCLDLQKRIPLINSDSREASSEQSGSQSNSEASSTPESAHDTLHDIVPAVQKAQGTVRNNTLPDDTRQSSNTVVSDTTTSQNQTGSFRHSIMVRKQLQWGVSAIKSATHDPIVGSSTQDHRVRAAGLQEDELRTIYVGNLANNTTPDDIRAHLGDLDISGVSDVFRLSSDGSKHTSFCVSVANQPSENAVFQANKWPRGVRLRSYISRKNQLQSVNTKRNPLNNHRQGNAHQRGHQHRLQRVHNRSYNNPTSQRSHSRSASGGRQNHFSSDGYNNRSGQHHSNSWGSRGYNSQQQWDVDQDYSSDAYNTHQEVRPSWWVDESRSSWGQRARFDDYGNRLY